MKIRYLGHSCFKITNMQGVTVLTDPYTKVGYELPKGIEADIVLVSHGHFDHNYVAAVGGNPTVVTTSGKIKDVVVEAIPTWHDPMQGKLRGNNNVYLIKTDDISVCHLGDLGEENNVALIEKVKNVDILMIPIGGTYTIDAEQAKKYVDAIAPKIVIPMHYKPTDGVLDIQTEMDFLAMFDEKTVSRAKCEVELEVENISKAEKRVLFLQRG